MVQTGVYLKTVASIKNAFMAASLKVLRFLSHSRVIQTWEITRHANL
jgi:hypothetical protein